MADLQDYVFITVALINVLIVLIEGSTIKSVNSCLPPAQNTFNIQCGRGFMVRITKSFYGYNSRGQCGYQLGDCIYEDHERHSCVGQESCTLPIPASNDYIPECQKDSSYYQIDYQCVPAAESYNICDTPLVTEQRGYIKTPNYPNNYGYNHHCITNIRVEKYQTVKLHVIDMDLESNGSYGCIDWMYAKDGRRSVTLCGRRWNEPLVMSSNELLIQLNTNSISNHKGFWLYFEATPPITTTTKEPTTPIQQKTSAPLHFKEPTIPIRVNPQYTEPENKLPFAEIVGGVIGTLSLILVILLVLLAVKWYKERRRRDNKNRFMEVQNPAYRNSTEFRQSRTEPCYNYMDV